MYECYVLPMYVCIYFCMYVFLIFNFPVILVSLETDQLINKSQSLWLATIKSNMSA